jgi:hypothetical protein
MRVAHGSSVRSDRLGTVVLTICLAAGAWTAAPAETGEPFPEIRPATRVEAISALTDGTAWPTACLTARLQSLGPTPEGAPAPIRRAVELIAGPVRLAGERRWTAPDGTIVRFTLRPGSFDRVHPADRDADGLPDIVPEIHRGIEAAHALLVEHLGLASPGPLEVVLADIGRLDGYTLPAAGRRERRLLVLTSSSADGLSAARAAAHQFAHAVAETAGSGLDPGWSEALAEWVVVHLDGGPTPERAELFSGRLRRLPEGLFSEDPALAAGNGLWLTFLEEAYGLASVRLAVEDLASGDAPDVALERALRRGTGLGLEAAFRDFHLWGVLVGERSDGRHFSFADSLAPPAYASRADGMPELSVQADPPVAGFGAASVYIRPGESEGGLTVLFEGDISGRWSADLVLERGDGSLQRVAVPVREGRGEITVPLDSLEEALLLVRNLSRDDDRALRYTWSVHRERDFPFALGALEATLGAESSGVLISWETLSEIGLLGFNLLRTDEESGETVRINPVWVPAVGDRSAPMSYQFLDVSAVEDARYLYRLEGITFEGLTTISGPVAPIASLPR